MSYRPWTESTADGAPAIVLRNVHYSIQGREIFTGLDLAVERGRISAIMGPSGAGKTTLLRLITGLLQADSGDIVVKGQHVARLRRRQLCRLRLQMGLLFQEGALFTDLDVFENVAFPLRQHTILSEPLLRVLVLLKLQAVGLRGAAGLMPAELSGGMARRAALARALVMDPDILLCDEPFNGLDPISTGVVIRLLRQMNEILGITVIIVSHDLPEVEKVAHTSCLLANGRVAAAGTPQALRQNDSTTVRQFMTGAADGPIPFHYPAPDYYRQLLDDP